ncbi:MAG: dihydropteroate synthase [Nitrosopumilus sp.]|nr:dihydropteroate synthase [Nitrosopumilus sp.]MDF2423043.1 dihydropteroate synthase [Nitrosopumilus sp.]MDF2424327.1 dihydropteroate synthase [Nitrosopumilus sp.]MDF2425317.1 dihydropteroate synthase [Nitrosopumilus sp.]MDF2427139.1 dihydropteroate synthase [Nitrosopumilus sp.]
MTVPRVSSALKAVDLKQVPPPLIIGERINTQGSRKAKKMVLEDDYDGLVDLGRMQVEDGAHCLDVCVATTERADELEFMLNLVKRLSLEIDAPLVIDSTDPEVIEAAVTQIPGRPIINSINLEGDGSRFENLAPIMAKYGLPSIALCIGPEGMAKTPRQKVDTAELLYETGKKYGLKIEQFIFDVLTFTLATGEDEFLDAGKNTLEGIRLVKEKFPNCYTTLGLSNISFGLAPYARKILNSVFLYHAVKTGLDTAIVNAKEIVPYGEIDEKEKKLAEDLIFNTHPNALSDLITYFENVGSKNGSVSKMVDVDPSWPAGKRANFRIVNRLKDGIQNDVVSAIAEKLGKDGIITNTDGILSLDLPKEATHDSAIRTLNEDLLPAMKEVGDKFGSGELILPFVLKSAECMKASVGELEKYLVKEEGTSKGVLVLGTVYGDVHDIGKNLVKTIFQNNGYTVHDLGKQVPLQKFLEKIDETKPDAIGLSALLVSTSKQMKFFVEYARKNNMTVPILCGGAAINTNYINRIAKEDGIYEPGVFYCNTMFEGLKTMDVLVSDEKPKLLADWKEKLENWKEKSTVTIDPDTLPKSEIKPVQSPTPEIIGEPIRLKLDQINMSEVWSMIDKKSLFKLSWGLRGKAGSESEEEHEQLLTEWKIRIIRDKLIEPEIVYGYFKCHNKGRKLLVENVSGDDVELEFPRSTKPDHLCLTDYFGENDIVAFQSVTVGNKVADIIEQWNKEDKYTDAYYLHGLAVEIAEALAEWVNRRIKSELNLYKGGLRYSWGFPSCPDVSQHHLVWKLLEPEKSGMTLTESGQIIPEQSTAAIVIHHPDAKYFVL